MKPTLKIMYQDNSDGRGWNVWCGSDRGWQPIIGCENPSIAPTLEEACAADPITNMDPDDYSSLENLPK
jgi:hypothetical protein